MKFSILLRIFIVFKILVISNSFISDCIFQTGNSKPLGTVYQCFTTNILASSSIYVTSITGKHLDQKNNSDVASLSIEGNWSLPFFPRNYSNFFPNIKSIRIYHSAIETLYGDELNEFPQLVHLDIKYSYLKTISSRLFEKTPNMVDIWFGNSIIEKVGHDLFTPLDVTQLKALGFEEHQCINQGITNGSTIAIISLINELKEKCPYDDEFPSTTTTTFLTTTTTVKNLFCTNENIEDFICDLKNSMTEVQEHLIIKDEEIGSTLNILRQSLTSANEWTIEKFTESSEKMQELEAKWVQINEELQIKEEEIESLKSDFEARTVTYNAVGSVYQCLTTNIPISSSKYVTSVTGKHIIGKSNKSVISIKIEGNYTLSFFPRDISKFFPKIKSILIYFTTIETLYGDELNEFPQLVHLNIESSNLTTISSRLFEKTPNMADIWLANNKIKKVGNDLFTPLNTTILKWIGFKNNACINRKVSNGTQFDIISLIDAIEQQCPYDDEFLTTTTSFLSTITQDLFCIDEKSVEDFVCDLKITMTKLQENLTTKDEKIATTLNILRQNLTEANKKTNESLVNFLTNVKELENQLNELNEELQPIKEEIKYLKSEFEARLIQLEEIALNAAEDVIILYFSLFLSCALVFSL
ncbi:hypothetical protein PVAND_016238 [Polypedilum vanderplanki]|uniref:Uncharacterized protein n=1 Tax=Polypedilum vanderplanki TaxID=319348 RepID=A0A9J6BFM9_POLVA|nr:hypothetical protein PVAND_016238 [Polypedilum vanderplanki]